MLDSHGLGGMFVTAVTMPPKWKITSRLMTIRRTTRGTTTSTAARSAMAVSTATNMRAESQSIPPATGSHLSPHQPHTPETAARPSTKTDRGRILMAIPDASSPRKTSAGAACPEDKNHSAAAAVISRPRIREGHGLVKKLSPVPAPAPGSRTMVELPGLVTFVKSGTKPAPGRDGHLVRRSWLPTRKTYPISRPMVKRPPEESRPVCYFTNVANGERATIQCLRACRELQACRICNERVHPCRFLSAERCFCL